MTLRLRLVLAYAYLVALVLVTAVSAVAGFVLLSRGIDQVLSDNVRSIEASMTMLESLERQDSATLSALLGAPGALDELRTADDAFREALTRARGNITEADENAMLERLQTAYADLVAARDEVIASSPERPLRAYEESVFPRFQAAKSGVRGLLEVNHAAMRRADQEARASARRSGAWIALLVTLAVVSLVLLTRSLQRRVLERLAAMRRVSRAIAAGDTRRRLVLSGDDELTEIGCRLNDILDQREELEGRWRGRLAVEKRLSLAFHRRLGGGTVFGLDGTVLIEPDDCDEAAQERLAGWIREHGSRAVEELASADASDAESGAVVAAEIGGERHRLELLHNGRTRPVAWLWAPS